MRSTHVFQYNIFLSLFVYIKSLNYIRKCIFLHQKLSGGVIGIFIVNFAIKNSRHKVIPHCRVCFLSSTVCITIIILWPSKIASFSIKNLCICRAHFQFWALHSCHPNCNNVVTKMHSLVFPQKHMSPLAKTNLRTQMQNILLWFFPFFV